MTTSVRTNGGALVVDLYGQWPSSDHDSRRLKKELRNALAGKTGPIIVHIHDAKSPDDLALLLAALTMAKVNPYDLVIVSASRRIREIFHVVDCPIWTYQTEEEAFSHIQRLRKQREGQGGSV